MEEVGDSAVDLVSVLSDLGYKFYWYSPSTRKIKVYPSTEILINSIADGEDANYVLSVGDLRSVSSPASSAWQSMPAQKKRTKTDKEMALL